MLLRNPAMVLVVCEMHVAMPTSRTRCASISYRTIRMETIVKESDLLPELLALRCCVVVPGKRWRGNSQIQLVDNLVINNSEILEHSLELAEVVARNRSHIWNC